MNKREAERRTIQDDRLRALGFTRDECESLRRISMTLRRWYENECNGAIQRDELTGKPYWHNTNTGSLICPTPDREKGAIKRLKAIMQNRNMGNIGADLCVGGKLSYYLQTDPRGAVLYIIRPGDVPEGKDVSAYYTNGLCVY